ncbi:hypothetical protein, partial [Cohnella terricola]|uniref:hypothetical protein n=1 Tax=Cohnella terricola TaxID=1289167 RepID=UPI001646F72E
QTEHNMIETAEKEYRDYYQFAIESINLLDSFVNSVELDAQVFLIFLSQIQKSTTLAVLSSLRRHDVQALMNIRHLLESFVLIVYSFIEKDFESYVLYSKYGYAVEKRDVKDRARKWLKAEFPEYSDKIKNMKDQINDFYAHANLLSAFANYNFDDDLKISLEIFDKKEDVFIRQRLWWIGNITFGIIDLIIKVNRKYPLITFRNDINKRMIKLAQRNNFLQEELTNLPNFSKHIGKTLE